MQKFLYSMMLVGMLSACSTTSDKTASSRLAAMDTSNNVTTSGVNGTGMLNGTSSFNPLTDPNNILSQRSVFFDFDSFTVSPDYRDMLSAHAKYLTNNQQATIIIQGNTDNRGTAEYNLALGQKRAEAVKRNMNLLGIPDNQIETVSFGKERPRELGHSEEMWAKNRRADIVYTGETQ